MSIHRFVGRLDRRTLLAQGVGLIGTLTLGTLLAGCGGGSVQTVSPGPGNGSATFLITWPDRTRLIPAASNSIKLTVTAPPRNLGEPPIIAERLVVRTSGETSYVSTELFDALPTGNVTVTAAAYSTADGTGVVQATASLVVSIRRNEITTTNLSLNSTIDRVQITPSAPFLLVGDTAELVASALDASGAVVITSGRSWSWTSNDGEVATLSDNGDRATITGLRVGNITVNAVEEESGKRAEVVATVIGPIVVPSASANVESDQSSNSPFQGNETTFQVQYAEAVLSGLPPGAMITGIQFRLDSVGSDTKPAVDLAYSDYIVQLAQATRNVNDISFFFAENMLNPVTVYNAPLSVAAADFPTGTSGTVPNEFGPLIHFSTPYIYRGGDLVLYISHSASSIPTPGAINNGVGVDAVRANPASGYDGINFSQLNAVRTGAKGSNVPIAKFTLDIPTNATPNP